MKKWLKRMWRIYWWGTAEMWCRFGHHWTDRVVTHVLWGGTWRIQGIYELGPMCWQCYDYYLSPDW